MCGFAGVFSEKAQHHQSGSVVRMLESITHRGPDDSGSWSDLEAGISLGSNRLAIIDLSDKGHQPMQSACGRFVIAFNGEIYNHLELRELLELEGKAPDWRGGSDTESVLAAISAWGVSQAIEKMAGMFAFALWDRQERCLFLVRDRFGEKPLYYGRLGSALFFASELKSIFAHEQFTSSIDKEVLGLFLRHGYIPAPHSIYKSVQKLPAGSLLVVSERQESLQRFWRPEERMLQMDPYRGSEEEALADFAKLLDISVRRQMISDVPLGAFLSGGIDSSLLVSLMQKNSSSPIETFTIGFCDKSYDESPYARAVAKHLGTKHTQLMVSSEQILDVVPKIPDIYDEPFADSSQIPTFLISQLARKQVTVSLTGDGGDELFGGYNHYISLNNLWRNIGRFPKPVKHSVARLISAIPKPVWEKLFTLFPATSGSPGVRAHRLAALLASGTRNEFFRKAVSRPFICMDNSQFAQESATAFSWPGKDWEKTDFFRQMMCLDTLTFLPDSILAKVDRAAMSVSLETRAPYLDHNLAEFAWSLPTNMKIRKSTDGFLTSKWLMKQLLSRYIPQKLIDRPKKGFSVPLANWLNGPLREWASELLQEKRIREEGFFCPTKVSKIWQAQLSGQNYWQHSLWDVLMFQAWLDKR